MAQAHIVSQAGLELVKRFEGFQARPLALPDGWWLVGFNHVAPEQAAAPLNEIAAEALLRQDLLVVEGQLNAHVFIALTQEQFDALVSFAFSIGWEAFRESEVLRHLNAGALVAAADSLLDWRYGAADGPPGLLSVLARRRAIEAAWLLEEGVHVPVASAWVRPRPSARIQAVGLAGQDPWQPADGGEGPAAQPKPAEDAITLRLRDILAAEPASARALLPPVVHEEMEDDLPLHGITGRSSSLTPPSWLETAAKDHVALGAFAVMGAVLVGVGLGLMPGAANFSQALAAVLFAIPGALIACGALFYLFRAAVEPKRKR